MSNSNGGLVRLMIETALASQRIETTSEKIDEITTCYNSIKSKTMNRRFFIAFMQMWIDDLIRKNYNE